MGFFKKKHPLKANHEQTVEVYKELSENLKFIKTSLNDTEDLSVRDLEFNEKKISIMFLNTLVNSEVMETRIIQQIINRPSNSLFNSVAVKQISKTKSLDDVVKNMVQGKAVIFIEDELYAVLLDTVNSEKRSLKEPISEQVIRGPHDGFIEDLHANLNIIRNKVKSRNLVMKYLTLGTESDTQVAIIYLSNIANQEIVKEVENRLTHIHTDLVQSPGHLEEFIEDSPFSPFPQMLNTERPDRVAANLMDGRIVVLTDGSPSALIMPITFFAFYQTPDDYNSRWFIGSFFRLIRLVSFIIAISLPAFYISIVSFHYELIPIDLIFNVKGSLEYVPFTPFVEAVAMQTTLELLREASIRLPGPIAQTIGVVGGLVIGTAVVDANLVSNTMIVIIALTAIASFVVPISEMGTSIRLLGFPLMVAAAVFGLVGMVFILMLILIHLCKLESFGSPYFAPFAPLRLKDFKDTIIRLPMWKMNQRPTTPRPQNLRRSGETRGWKRDE